MAMNKDGEVIASSGEASEAAATDIATIAQVSMETAVIESTGDGFFMAHPATTGTSGENIVGAVAIIWSPAQAMAEVAKAKFMSFAVAGIAFLIMCTLSALALRSMMSRPLQDVGKLVNEIADGHYEQSAAHLGRGDEIGSIARNVDNLREQLAAAREEEEARHAAQEEQQRVVERLSEGLHRLSKGDLTRTIDQPFADEYEALRNNYNQSVQTLVGIIDSVIDTSARIRGNSEEISQSSGDLSRRTESQAATLEETAAALDELTASVKSAAEGAREVEGIVSGARATAEQGGEVVSAAVDAMSRIESSSEQIAQIISVIDDIAFQTNLLALNAGVEAARAGEAGRGFAVVASEVRALAQRSSEAAQEIKGLISESSQQVNQGVDLVGRTGEELNKIIESVSNISGHVSSIATGAEEQSISLGEINTGVTQLDQVTQHNAAMVEESTAASQILRNDANDLANQVSVFKTSGNVVGFGSGGGQPAQRAARSA
jgi:methyl-accepting chemotaxis protein